VLGRAARTGDERLGHRFLCRHPDAALYAGFKDFHFYRVELERAHLVSGFGNIRWLDAAERKPEPAPAGLAGSEAGIVTHMNGDHADALQLFAGKLLGLPGNDWRMTGVDAEGIDLRRGGQVARVPFDMVIADAADARKALISLVARARAV
jgi:putative heme iron utilization protein